MSGEEGERPRTPAQEIPAHWADRQDPDLAAEQESGAPSRKPPVSARPPGASKYGWFVGVVAVLLLAYISLNTLNTPSLGRGVPAGQPLPPFAVPLATSDLDGDANLAARANQGARTPACGVRDPRAINSCTLAGKLPVVVAFFSLKNEPSVRQLDVLQRVARREQQTRFVAIALRGDRQKVRELVRAHGWSFPVGYDRHADIGARYGVPDLPAITFAYPGPVIARSTFKALDEGQLDAEVRAIRQRPPRGRPAP